MTRAIRIPGLVGSDSEFLSFAVSPKLTAPHQHNEANPARTYSNKTLDGLPSVGEDCSGTLTMDEMAMVPAARA